MGSLTEKRISYRHSSLAISPNLEAMLEYSEKARRVKEIGGPSGAGPPTSPLTRRFSFASGPEGGLPPPPRRPGRLQSPIISEPQHGIEEKIENENSLVDLDLNLPANPYINPVPFFEDSPVKGKCRLPGIREDEDRVIEGFEADLSPQGGAFSGRVAGEESSPPGSPGDVRRSHDNDLQQPSPAREASSQPSSPLATFARVDNLNKFFGKSKARGKRNSKISPPPPVKRRPSTSNGTERAEVASKLARGLILVTRGRLASKNGKNLDATGMYQAETPVLDIRRAEDDDFGDRASALNPAQPLCLSHASHSSASIAPSTPSLYSVDSSSSSYDHIHHDGSDGDHNRISISSTIYPPSSQSNHHSPSTPRLSPIVPLDRMSSFRNFMGGGHRSVQSSGSVESDRESFIDMISPTPQTTSFQPLAEQYSPRAESEASPYLPAAQSRPNTSDSDTHRIPMFNKSRGRSRSPKPPIPSTPKPIFNRPTTPLGISTRLLPSPKPSPVPSPLDVRATSEGLPSTSNLLDPEARAELIRKSQKLAKMFGQPPGAEALNQQCFNSQSLSLRQRVQHSRGSASISIGEALSSPAKERSTPVWPPPEGTQYMTVGGRRHSNPLPPDDFSFLPEGGRTESHDDHDSHEYESDHAIEIGTEEGVPLPASDFAHLHQNAKDQKIRPDTPTSFIDLSDAEEPPSPDDNSSIINRPSAGPGGGQTGSRRRALSAAQSLYENMSPEEQLEEERRRKREKLAKLHRFLGSRVPTNLALGLPGDPADSLPPITFAANPDLDATKLDSPTMPFPPDEMTRKIWLRRRRSSSVVALPSSWSDDVDRLKEDLNDREKAINVKRAQKMERVFGVAPPQTLYHTRHMPSPSFPVGSIRTNIATSAIASQPSSPTPKTPTHVKTSPFPYPKPKLKKSDRPGTSESSKALLPNKGEIPTQESLKPVIRRSQVYTHYQHSLNSLNDIIDRDDKESLAELHEYLHSGEDDLNFSPGSSPTSLQEFARSPLPANRRLSTASIKSERRRSLPARTSIASITTELTISTVSTDSPSLNNRSSVISITTPKPESTDFQLRRRRAAKLTQFFGVNYRELIHDILESIEKGLEDERKHGTLNPDEVEDLLQKLRALRTKRGRLY